MSTNGVVGIELPESRKVALETTINQLRLARKSLLIVNLENGIEDRVLDLITDCVHHLQPVLDTCVVVRVRSDKKEAEELSSDISESVGEVFGEKNMLEQQKILKALEERNNLFGDDIERGD